MLYALHEAQRVSATPLRLAAEASQILLRNPWNPISWTPAARAAAAASEIVETNLRSYGKPSFGLERTVINGRAVAIEEEVFARKPFCQLRRFRRVARRPDDPKVLIVAPLSGHFATLLRGTVAALLPDHEVTITDWRDARNVPLVEGPFHLDDYVDYVIEYLRLLGPDTHVLAVCQPSVPVLAAVSHMAAQKDPCCPKSMTLMGGPVDTRRNPTVPNELATSRSLTWFERSVINRVPPPYPGFWRRVYPGFLQLTGFMTMNLDRHVGAHLRLFHHLVEGDGDSAEAHRRFYDEYRAVMDLPAEYYLDTVERVFQRQDLARGRFTYRGSKIDPGAIENTALMTVEGELDDISGLGQTQAAQDLCRSLPDSMRMHHVQEKVGHYGVFNGRRWRSVIAPKVKAFIAAHRG